PPHALSRPRLEPPLRTPPTVRRPDRPLAPRPPLVDVAGDDLLPGPRFPPDEHGALGGRHLLREPQHVLERARLAERLHEPRALAAADLLFQLLVLRLEQALLRRAAADRHEVVVGKRLLDVVERALVHRLDRALL